MRKHLFFFSLFLLTSQQIKSANQANIPSDYDFDLKSHRLHDAAQEAVTRAQHSATLVTLRERNESKRQAMHNNTHNSITMAPKHQPRRLIHYDTPEISHHLEVPKNLHHRRLQILASRAQSIRDKNNETTRAALTQTCNEEVALTIRTHELSTSPTNTPSPTARGIRSPTPTSIPETLTLADILRDADTSQAAGRQQAPELSAVDRAALNGSLKSKNHFGRKPKKPSPAEIAHLTSSTMQKPRSLSPLPSLVTSSPITIQA